MKQHTKPGFIFREYIRCPDCEYRGDLDTSGRPIWNQQGHVTRIAGCSTCGDRGEIQLPENAWKDPYRDRPGRDGPDLKTRHYRIKRERAAWTQRNRFKNDPDWKLAHLMEEPPGGFNYGRKRGSQGGWMPLEPAEFDEDTGQWLPASSRLGISTKRFLTPRVHEKQRAHGTAWSYRHRRCRCTECAAWKSEQNRLYRESNKRNAAAYMREYRKRQKPLDEAA